MSGEAGTAWKRRRRRSAALALVLVVAPGCRERAAGAEIDIVVDGRTVQRVEQLEPGRPLALRELVADADYSAWKLVEGLAHGGRLLRVADPAESYRGQELVILDLSGDGEEHGAGLGVVPLDEHGRVPKRVVERPALFLEGLHEIHVRTRDQAPAEGSEPTPLRIRTPAGETILDAAALAALETLSPRTAEAATLGGMHQQSGYHLAGVLALATDVARIGSVRLVGRDGAELELAGEVVRSRNSPLPLLKRNRRGALRFSLWVAAEDGLKEDQELRDVERIDVQLLDGSGR